MLIVQQLLSFLLHGMYFQLGLSLRSFFRLLFMLHASTNGFDMEQSGFAVAFQLSSGLIKAPSFFPDGGNKEENVVSELNGDVAHEAKICGCDEKYAVKFILSATSISGFLFRDRAPPAASENADAGRDRPAQSERERR